MALVDINSKLCVCSLLYHHIFGELIEVYQTIELILKAKIY